MMKLLLSKKAPFFLLFCAPSLLIQASTATATATATNATDTATDVTGTVPNSKNDPRTFFGGTDHDEYLDWVNTALSNSSYDSAIFLPNAVDATQGIAMHWSIIINEPYNTYIDLALAVRATGWLGFGLSENGGMTGSDIMIYEPRKNPLAVLDAYVQGQRAQPILDACQDWQLVSSSSSTNTGTGAGADGAASDDHDFIMVQVRRKLDTGDSQDLRILNDTSVQVPAHRVIAAWGDDDDEGVSYHGSRTARGAIRWFGGGSSGSGSGSAISAQSVESESGSSGGGGGGDEESLFMQNMARQSNGSFFVGPKELYNIKANDTEYVLFCTTANDLRAMGVPLLDNTTAAGSGMSLIGFAPIIDNVEHVHHFIITASYAENNNVTTLEHCATAGAGLSDMLYGWAPGETPLALPDNVGFTLGGPDGYNFFAVQIHYDNPQLKQGAVDKSGVEFYYSTQPREHTAGYLVLGDSLVRLAGQSIAPGLTDYDFFCPGECSALALSSGSRNDTTASGGGENDDQTVTVISESLHMHKSGTSAYNQHLRSGEVIRTGKAEYFDFAQQGGQVVQQEPFEIRAGDSFHTRCFYQNEDGSRKFGMGSSDEMCMAFLLYYPRKTLANTGGMPWMCGIGVAEYGLPECETSWKQDAYLDTVTDMEDDEQAAATIAMQRTFGIPSTRCLANDDSDNVDVDAVTGGNSGSIQGNESAAVATMSTFGAGTWTVVLTLTFMMTRLF